MQNFAIRTAGWLLLRDKLCKLCNFFLSYFKHNLLGFMRREALLGCSKDKLNIKEHKLNISALFKLQSKRLNTRSLPTRDFWRWSITMLHLQFIIYVEAREVFLLFLSQLNFAEGVIYSFQSKKKQTFLLQTYPQGMYISNSTKEATFCCWNKHPLDLMLSILISTSKGRDCLHCTNGQFFDSNWKLVPVPRSLGFGQAINYDVHVLTWKLFF